MVGCVLIRSLLGLTLLFALCLASVSSSTSADDSDPVSPASSSSSSEDDTPVPSGCGEGWSAFRQGCYVIEKFRLGVTFQTAYRQCRHRDSEPAELRTREVHQLVAELSKSENSWIGLTDVRRAPTPQQPIPYWIYGKRTLEGSSYQPRIETAFYQQWNGQTCFYMNGTGSIVTSKCTRQVRAVICQKPRADVQVCPRCTIKRRSEEERHLVEKSRCSDFLIVARMAKESNSHFLLDIKAICSNTSAAFGILSDKYAVQKSTAYCVPVERQPEPKLLPVQKPLASPMTSRCKQPCGLGLRSRHEYLLAGTVHGITGEFSFQPGVAIRWARAKSYFASPLATATCGR
eukprot:scpid89764/ scgid20413/ 